MNSRLPLPAWPDDAGIVADAAAAEAFVIDWRKRYRGRALAVAQPRSTEAVAALVRHCAQAGIPIVPQGGNTGLVGGGTPDDSGRALVLSLARMNRVRAIDTANDTLTAEAGCVLADLQRTAREAGRLFPLSLAAEGSCTIGGNLATNAGGVQVLRYGNARELCLGLEVVTAQGEIWHGLRGLRKDNTGYDLRDLFIGAEGTLGIITAATLKLFPLPAAQLTAFAAVPSVQAAVALLDLAKRRLAASLTAFELISEFCLSLVDRHFPQTRRPLAAGSPYYVLLESSDAEGEAHAQALFEALMAEALEAGLVTDAAVAASIAQSRAFWALRENIPLAQAMEGRNIKHDIGVPISSIADYVEQTGAEIARAAPGVHMVVFGHLGDGNLHYNVSPAPGADEDAFMATEPLINRIVYDAVDRHHGSISAEHGLGQLKREENLHYKSPVEIALMRAIKQALDPQGLLNPGKVLPDPSPNAPR
jgi:FAD/FMN-containing dehydrogenase